MHDYAPIDADGHVMETDDELRRYLPPPFACSYPDSKFAAQSSFRASRRAQARPGIQVFVVAGFKPRRYWMPAFAGMTVNRLIKLFWLVGTERQTKNTPGNASSKIKERWHVDRWTSFWSCSV